jgi:HK97 family phage major capsid protein
MLSKEDRALKLARMKQLVELSDQREADNRGLTGVELRELRELDDALTTDGASRRANAMMHSSSTDTTERADYTPSTAEEKAFSNYLRSGTAGSELRTSGMSEGTGNAGGFLVPQGFWQNLQVAEKVYGGLSNDFDQLETSDGRVMPYPTINPTAIVGSYVSENTQVGFTTYTFGNGMLYAWMLNSGVILASLQLVQDSAFNTDSFVSDRVGESIGRKMAVEAVSGAGPSAQAATGINPSLGAFQAVSGASGGYLGLGTATSVKTFAAPTGATELVGNVLSPATCFNMIAGVDPAYWEGAAFYMNATQALNERQVVDSNGRPLLNYDNGWADGAIGTIAGFPVKVVNEVPNLVASTLGGPIFGNMKHAMVQRKVTGAGIMRLTERYADFLQVGYLAFQRFDFQPKDLRAAVVVKPAAT